MELVVNFFRDIREECFVKGRSDVEHAHELLGWYKPAAPGNAREICNGAPIDRDFEVLAFLRTAQDMRHVVVKFLS